MRPAHYPRLGARRRCASSSRDPRALREVVELIVADAADGEVLRIRMREIETGDGGRRQHGEVLGQRHADRVRAQQREQRRLHRMVRTRRIARRGADAAILLANQRRVVERFVARERPKLAPHLGVQPLGERFGQAIGERLQHDRAVVVLLRFEFRDLLFDAETGGHRKRAQVIGAAGGLGCNEIGKAEIGLA